MKIIKNNTKRKSLNQKSLLKNYQLYLLLLPALLFIIVFKYGPLYGLQIAFKDYNARAGIMGSLWIGLEHFSRFFNTPKFGRLLWNTLSLSFYELLISFPIPIIIALMINQLNSKRYGRLLENVFYVPHFISVVVLVGMLQTFFSLNGGIVNIFRDLIGLERINYMGRADAFRNLYVWSGVWKNAGWNTIIYSAALTGIDNTLYEAAKVDGANKLHCVLHIDIPGILPTIVLMFVMGIGNIMSIGFEKAYLMQNNLNISTSEIIATYVYKIGLQGGQYDYATAIGLFNNVINVILLVFANKFSKRLSGNGLW